MGPRGRLITIEGVEGAGKSTLIGGLEAALIARGHRVLTLREPGGTRAGDRIRALLLDADIRLSSRAELLLFCASRAQLVETVILPALAQGQIVLCDRFIDSSVAYQGAGRGLGEVVVDGLNQFATGGLCPDMTLYLDLPLEVGLERARVRRGDDRDDRFEGEALQFHHTVRAGFERLVQGDPQRFRRLDANQTPEQVLRAALQALPTELLEAP